jgi:hypothetical protein
MKLIRQGDLLFIPCTDESKRSDWANRENDKRKDGVIREGEATGHHHRIETLTDAEVFRPSWSDAVVIVGENGVRIVHEEHGPVTLEPNTTYRVHVAREFDYLRESARYVWD